MAPGNLSRVGLRLSLANSDSSRNCSSVGRRSLSRASSSARGISCLAISQAAPGGRPHRPRPCRAASPFFAGRGLQSSAPGLLPQGLGYREALVSLAVLVLVVRVTFYTIAAGACARVVALGAGLHLRHQGRLAEL